MPRHMFLMLMEQASCRRFVEAHHAAATCVMSGWKHDAVPCCDDARRKEIEQLRERADREKRRHLRWLNFRRANAGLPTVEA